MGGRGTRDPARLVVALAGCLLLMATGCRPDPAAQELKRYRKVGDFALTERSDRTVTREELNGKILVVDFFFAACSAQCELLSQRMAQIQRATAGMNDVVLLSLTVDPQSDSPERLRYYASRFDADAKRWLFLTGDRAKLYKLIQESFLQPVAQGASASSAGFIHSERIVLVDQTGTVRAYYEGLEKDASAKVVAGIQRLRSEQ